MSKIIQPNEPFGHQDLRAWHEVHEPKGLDHMQIVSLNAKPNAARLNSFSLSWAQWVSYSGWWARATPLKNMSSSIGMIRNPIYGKIKNVPNHQPVLQLRSAYQLITGDLVFLSQKRTVSTRNPILSRLSGSKTPKCTGVLRIFIVIRVCSTAGFLSFPTCWATTAREISPSPGESQRRLE